MPVGRSLFGGSPYLGVYLRADDRYAIVPSAVSPALSREIARVLGVTVVRTNVGESEVVGALVALTSHGAIVGDDLSSEERAALETVGPVSVIRSRQNAIGNNVLANDRGALVHPEFSDAAVHAIARGLGVPARRGTIAGLGTVGMAAVATNQGVVVHPRSTEAEAKAVEDQLGVPVHRSTGNFGVPIVGACLVANSHGMIVGRPTTPVEIVHLQEGLNLFD
ncbi:Translation initiation factor IF6 [mine drainage metagenome]|uniref:Translation initiation factor IF6 n=1 Tax=mine drainage metagenome TaxID=410659 RepID=T1BBS1_9ZZZZ